MLNSGWFGFFEKYELRMKLTDMEVILTTTTSTRPAQRVCPVSWPRARLWGGEGVSLSPSSLNIPSFDDAWLRIDLIEFAERDGFSIFC